MSKKPSSWRDVLKVHPAADLFPLMLPDESKALGDDIKNQGLAGLCRDSRHTKDKARHRPDADDR
jgi:hypothetical protein